VAGSGDLKNPDPRRRNAPRHGANNGETHRLFGCPAFEVEPVGVDERPG
jgi:hypothetical protein